MLRNRLDPDSDFWPDPESMNTVWIRNTEKQCYVAKPFLVGSWLLKFHRLQLSAQNCFIIR